MNIFPTNFAAAYPAGMADLDWYWMDRVMFVTRKENAKLRKENEDAAGLEKPAPGKASKP